MEQALVVAVRFHEGRYHGSDGWPPAPSRLFQALMAGAARGAHVPQTTVAALDWLEELPHPVIAAPRAVPGQGYTGFVPNNDLDAALSKKDTSDIDKATASVRDRKLVRPVLFDVEAPVLYCWPIEGQVTHAKALCEAAERLYQLGRGIDMAWAQAAVVDGANAEQQLIDHRGIVFRPSAGNGSGRELLCPRPGSRRSLTDRFAGMRSRFRAGGTNRKPLRVFVQAPKPLLAKVAYDAPPVRLIFELREPDAKSAFAVRPLAEAAQLVTEVRDRVAKRLSEAAPALRADIERYLVGRDAMDADKTTRVRIVPIPSIGHPHADMMIRRLAVYVPQSCPLPSEDLAWAFAQVAWADDDGVVLSEMQPGSDDRMVNRYERFGRRWQSVTPLALSSARRRRIDPARLVSEVKDGAERAREEARAAYALRQALRHAGVTTAPIVVRVQREPYDTRGKCAEPFAAGTRFPRAALWHASISFAAPIAGPLLLGDGRYLGLGLMQPDEPMPGILEFTIREGLTDAAEPLIVARAARRALIARVRDFLPRGRAIPSYVTGHEEGGRPSRSGFHRHIAVAADLPRRRLLYVAPTWLQRHGVRWRDVSEQHVLVEQALEGMEILLAGNAGRLVIAPSTPDAEHDPLFAPARVWESVADYQLTRYRRRLTDAQALKSDILVELRRRAWPAPETVEVLSVHRGPRGALSGRLRITFATVQTGPLLLGRTAHRGGGLFARAASEDK